MTSPVVFTANRAARVPLIAIEKPPGINKRERGSSEVAEDAKTVDNRETDFALLDVVDEAGCT